jgi:hypothetical protein
LAQRKSDDKSLHKTIRAIQKKSGKKRSSQKKNKK